MIEILKFLSNKYTNKTRHNHEELKIHPLKIQFDELTHEPYVMITPISKFKLYKYPIEDLIENESVLDKLEKTSYRYIFYAYGMLKASEKNDFYTLEEILLLNKEILVKNVGSSSSETWNKEQFENSFILLDKKSLKQATEFFLSLKANTNTPKLDNSKHLKLIK